MRDLTHINGEWRDLQFFAAKWAAAIGPFRAARLPILPAVQGSVHSAFPQSAFLKSAAKG